MERMWFYLHENQQKGPVAQDELMRLLEQGILSKETLIWTEGMADWQPASMISLTARYVQSTQERPTAVKVFGIISIVLGSLGLLCTPIGIAAIFVPAAGTPVDSNPVMIYLLLASGLKLIMSAILLAAGIGLLYLRRWARQTLCIFGWFSIAWTILSLVITLTMMGSNLSSSSPELKMTAMSSLYGGICGGIIGLIYPVFLVVYMRKPRIVAACNR